MHNYNTAVAIPHFLHAVNFALKMFIILCALNFVISILLVKRCEVS